MPDFPPSVSSIIPHDEESGSDDSGGSVNRADAYSAQAGNTGSASGLREWDGFPQNSDIQSDHSEAGRTIIQTHNTTNSARTTAVGDQPVHRGLAIVGEITTSGYTEVEQLHQLDVASLDQTLTVIDRFVIMQASHDLVARQTSDQERLLAQIRTNREGIATQLASLRNTQIEVRPTITFTPVNSPQMNQLDQSPVLQPWPSAPASAYSNVNQPRTFPPEVWDRINQPLNTRTRQALGDAAPPILYGDPYDALVGNSTASNTTSTDHAAILPRPPRHTRIGLRDRSLVQARQARALAGLDTSEMDDELALRIL